MVLPDVPAHELHRVESEDYAPTWVSVAAALHAHATAMLSDVMGVEKQVGAESGVAVVYAT